MASVAEKIQSGRGINRTRVLMTGTLMTPDGAFRVRIRDISRTGAQIAAEGRMPQDCDAVLKRGSLFVATKVSWARGHDAGLEFYRELTPREVDSAFHSVALGG